MVEINKAEYQGIILRDRQWSRHCRITHARSKIKEAKLAEDEAKLELWRAVFRANVDGNVQIP